MSELRLMPFIGAYGEIGETEVREDEIRQRLCRRLKQNAFPYPVGGGEFVGIGSGFTVGTDEYELNDYGLEITAEGDIRGGPWKRRALVGIFVSKHFPPAVYEIHRARAIEDFVIERSGWFFTYGTRHDPRPSTCAWKP